VMAFAGRTLALTARPLPDGGAVLALLDLTTRRRLETIRRDFVANVSHELKTPLTVISGFAETLLDPGVSPAERRQFAGTIQTNVMRMQRIVDDLLDLARYESGGWVPNPVTVDVNAAAAEALGLVHGEATRKKLALRATIAAGAEHATADPTALRQILQNLVEYAIRKRDRVCATERQRHHRRRARHGSRDTARAFAAHLRALLSRRRRSIARGGRHGPRLGHREALGGGTWRGRTSEQYGGRRDRDRGVFSG